MHSVDCPTSLFPNTDLLHVQALHVHAHALFCQDSLAKVHSYYLLKVLVNSELFVFLPQPLTHSNLFALKLDPATQQSSSIGPTRGDAMGGSTTAP